LTLSSEVVWSLCVLSFALFILRYAAFYETIF